MLKIYGCVFCGHNVLCVVLSSVDLEHVVMVMRWKAMDTVWRVSINRLVSLVLPLPTGAFIFCVLYSLMFNFEQSTGTHCKEVELLHLTDSCLGI